MCMDANAAKWAARGSATSRRPQGAVGVMYMLEGGTDASNTDPYAKSRPAENDWVKTGPHVMIVGSKEILAGLSVGREAGYVGALRDVGRNALRASDGAERSPV